MNEAQYMLPPAPGQSPPPPGQLALVVPPPSGLVVVPASVPPTQTPFMQPAPFGQTLPHPLQLRGSYMRLVQNGFCPAGSRQIVMPAPQVIAGKSVHRPPWQYWVAAQAWPHAPQFVRSFARSVQLEPPAAFWQSPSIPTGPTPPSGPGPTPPSPPVTIGHLPCWHCVPGAHTRPQPPQFLLSLRRSKPSSTLPLQSLSRPSQISGDGSRGGRLCTTCPPCQI